MSSGRRGGPDETEEEAEGGQGVSDLPRSGANGSGGGERGDDRKRMTRGVEKGRGDERRGDKDMNVLWEPGSL